MKIEFDETKSRKNAVERELPFDRVSEFDWESSTTNPDDRFVYPEPRYSSFGLIGERLHYLCFTPILGGIRVISFRKANKREISKYEKAFETTNQ